MNTAPQRFEEYARVGQILGKLTDAASKPSEEIDRLLSTPVELPDGRLVTCRDLTADDLTRDDLMEINRFMKLHARRVTTAAHDLN